MAWEYKTVKGITEKEMNELGLEGWELVKFDSLGGTAIFKWRHHWPPIRAKDFIDDDGIHHGAYSSWGRKHPDD